MEKSTVGSASATGGVKVQHGRHHNDRSFYKAGRFGPSRACIDSIACHLGIMSGVEELPAGREHPRGCVPNTPMNADNRGIYTNAYTRNANTCKGGSIIRK